MFSLLRSRAVFALSLVVLCALFLNTGCEVLGEDEPDLPGRLDGDGGYFGNTVALRGDAALVGAAYAGAGKAFAYRQRATDWQQASRLDPGNIPGDANFSWDLAVHGDWAAIGAFDSPSGEARAPGAVYLFQRHATGWTFQQRLRSDFAGEQDMVFGWKVDMEKRWLAIGSIKEDRSDSLYDTGAVHLYYRRNNTWERVSRLAPTDVPRGGRFGLGVSLSGDLLAVGARPDRVYVYRRNGEGTNAVWKQQAMIQATDNDPSIESFGGMIALDGSYLAVGAPNTDEFEGAVYVFERNGPGQWKQVARLKAREEGFPRNYFGSSVALSDDCLIAGST